MAAKKVLQFCVQVVVEALKHHGVEYMFGVVGIPVVEIAIAAQQVRLQCDQIG